MADTAPTNRPPITFNMVAPGQYVAYGDFDGDGDMESTGIDMDTEEARRFLLAYGYHLNNKGEPVPIDSVESDAAESDSGAGNSAVGDSSSGNSSRTVQRGAATRSTSSSDNGPPPASGNNTNAGSSAGSNDGAPQLPPPPDTSPNYAQVSNELALSGDLSLEGADLMLALFALVRAAKNEQDFKRNLRNLSQKQMLQQKSNAIRSAETRIQEERTLAWINFGISVAAAVVTAGLGAAGAAGKLGAVASKVFLTAAMSVGQVVSAGGQLLNKLVFAQALIDYYNILEKMQELLATREEQKTKEYDDSHQAARDEFKSTQDMIKQTQERRQQETNKSTS